MNENELNYPVLWFADDIAMVAQDEAGITTCTKAALKGGLYDGMLIVDSAGRAHRVRGANKLQGFSLFHQYNLFLQMIRVELVFEEDARSISVDEVKELVFGASLTWHGLESGGVDEEIREELVRAETIPEIIRLLSED